ncbi:MAG: Txe/YoeB family addiction module toxin [Segetibacter sp.]|nr:Txe/YoeB family addiction module toxin [Segetibacter sp.]
MAFNKYNEWIEQDKDVFNKIKELIKDISRDPFKGLGKPEPLKGNYAGFWSRRITQEHRLIYSVSSDLICVVKCNGHYFD